MPWSTPPNIDGETMKKDACREIENLTNAVGQFLILEAKNRGIKDVHQVCTAAINLAVKMTAALSGLSDNRDARLELANNLANTFREGIMETVKSIDENKNLQNIKRRILSDGLSENIKQELTDIANGERSPENMSKELTQILAEELEDVTGTQN